MITYSELRDGALRWPGVLDPTLMDDQQRYAGEYVADLARRRKWRRLLRELDRDRHLVDVKQWQPGASDGIAPLHRAAWHGARLRVVSALLFRGAMRTQPDAAGRTAHDIAAERGHGTKLLDALRPAPPLVPRERIDRLSAQLASAVDDLLQPVFPGRDLQTLFRYPPLEMLHESQRGLWMDVPYLWGGFRVRWAGDSHDALELVSGYRELDPDGAVHVATATHRIDDDGVTEVAEAYY